jgi:hypothetical protein
MMSYYDESGETVAEFDRDGWHIRVRVTPDYDYRPGEDDDVYPRLTVIDRWTYDWEADRDEYTGQFVRRPLGPFPGVVQGEAYLVEPDEVDRLAELWGESPRKVRRVAEADARALACGDLSHVNVDVYAERGGIQERACIGGVGYDVRDEKSREESERYVRDEIPDYYGLVDEAIKQAEASLAASLKPVG